MGEFHFLIKYLIRRIHPKLKPQPENYLTDKVYQGFRELGKPCCSQGQGRQFAVCINPINPSNFSLPPLPSVFAQSVLAGSFTLTTAVTACSFQTDFNPERDRFMFHFIKPTIFILAMLQFCSIGRAQQDYRIDEVTEWNLQAVIVPREISESKDNSQNEISYREKRVTVRKPVTEELVRVEQNIVYKPVLVTNSFQTTAAIPAPRLSFPQRRLQWTPGAYRVDPISGQTTFQRGALRWNTNSTFQPAYQNTQTNVPVYAYQPELVETRTPVTVTRYVDEVVTQRIPLEPKVINDTVEKLVPVRVRYKTPINSAGQPIGPTERIVVQEDAVPMDTVPALDPPTDEVTFRANKKSKPYTSVLKPKTPSSTTDGFTGVLKPVTKSQSPVTKEIVESNFKETTPENSKISKPLIETPNGQINESGTPVPALESSMKSVWTK